MDTDTVDLSLLPYKRGRKEKNMYIKFIVVAALLPRPLLMAFDEISYYTCGRAVKDPVKTSAQDDGNDDCNIYRVRARLEKRNGEREGRQRLKIDGGWVVSATGLA